MTKALCHSETTWEPSVTVKRWHPLLWFPAQPLTWDFRCLLPFKTSRKLPHASENQERWTIKELELSRCICTTDSLFHGECPHCFGHAVQCNWFYFSCFVIIAAVGSDTLKNSTCLPHSQNFKHFDLYFCIRIGINIREQYFKKNNCAF